MNQKWNITDAPPYPGYVKSSKLSAFLLSAYTKKQGVKLWGCSNKILVF